MVLTRRASPLRGALTSGRRAIALALGAALVPWIFHSPALAEPGAGTLPAGGQITAGSATLTYTTNRLQVDQATQNTVINWGTFSVGRDAWVNFNQPNSASLALNRVVGSNPSEIYGRVTANGGFWITNPNGILFAPSAAVDVGALFATTLSIADKDFLAGRYNFYNAGGAGSVLNKGNILAVNGYAAFAGPKVQNDGIIIARAGTVSLVAGERVSLDMIGDGLVNVSVDQAALNASAINSGRIEADGGNVLLTARSANALLDTVVNNSGAIRANSLLERNGEIVLDGGPAGVVRNTGVLSAAGVALGTTGGTVKVLGEKVALEEGARIDASGDVGGGTVLIGGNFHGQGVEANAGRTYIAHDATIHADANLRGNGGRIIIWSDEATAFHGRISAKGGAQSGDGGFAEVSSKGALAFAGRVDLTACHGAVGKLVLDPTDIVIANSTSTGNDGASAGRVFFGDGAGVEPWDVTPAALNAVGASVILQATRDITFVDPVALNTAGAGLTAQAGRNISVLSTGSITTNNGAIRLEADSVHSSGGAANGNGTLAISGPVSSGGAPITLTGASFAISANVNADAGGISLARSVTNTSFALGTGGELTQSDINNLLTSGPLVLGSATTAGSDGAGASMQTLSGRTLTINSPLSIAAANGSSVSLVASNGITVDGSVTTHQSTTINADADNNGGGTLTVAAAKKMSTSGNALSISAADLNLQGSLESGTAPTTLAASNSRSIGMGSASGAFRVDNTELAQITSGGLTLQTAGNISVNGVTSAATSGAGQIDLSPGATGTVTIGSSSSDSSTFAGGVVVTGGAANNIAGTIAAAGTGNIDFGAAPVSVTDTATVGGASSGSIMLGAVKIAAGKTLTVGAGAITPVMLSSVAGTAANGENLTINTRGTVTVSGPIGTAAVPLNSVTVTNSGDTTFQSTLNAQTATLASSTGTIAFQGDTVLGTLATAAQPYSVSITGSSNMVTSAVSFLNTGTLTLGDAATDKSVFVAGVAATAPQSKSLGGTIGATNGSINFGGTPTTLNADTTVSAANNAVMFGALNGAANLTVNSGAATTFDGAVGATTALAGLITDAPGTTVINGGSVRTTGAQVYADSVSGNNVSLTSTGGGAISAISGGNGFAGTMNVSGGATQITNGNSLTLGDIATGDLLVSAAGALNLGTGVVSGTLQATTNGAAITQSGQLTVSGTTTIDASGAAITLTAANDFQGTVNLKGTTTQITDANALALGNINTGALIAISNGALNLGAGKISGALSATTNDAGSISQAGPLTVTGIANLQAGGQAIVLNSPNDFVAGVTAVGGFVALSDVNLLIATSINAGSGAVNLQAGSLSASGSLQGGSATLSSANPVGGSGNSLNINFGAGSVVLTGSASAWNLSGPAVPQPAFTPNSQNTGANIFYNNGCISGPACAGVFAVTASIGASVTQIAAQALKDAQSTDSVAKQIDYGFAGDVGTTPPMDHRIDETGISTPQCFEESRENQPCSVDSL
jgi:filamentous hemagglutinin family protein